jgi:hypothetical protein
MYGIKIKPTNDPFVAAVKIALGAFLEGLVPGAFLVDTIPICGITLLDYSWLTDITLLNISASCTCMVSWRILQKTSQ